MDANLLKSTYAKQHSNVHEYGPFRVPCCVELIDAKTLLASCGDDPILLNKMIRSFDVYAQDHLREVDGAIECGDTAELGRVAHRLKGLISHFSTTAANAVAVLERTAATGKPNGLDQQFVVVCNLVNAISAVLADIKIEDLKRRVRGMRECSSASDTGQRVN